MSHPERTALLEKAFKVFQRQTVALVRAVEADELPEWIEPADVDEAREIIARVEAAVSPQAEA